MTGEREPMFGTFRMGLRPTPTTPFIQSKWNLRRHYIVLAAALVPALGAAVWFHGAGTMLVLAVSLVAAAAVELTFSRVRTKRFRVSEVTLVTALIFALILPAGIPIWMVGLGAAFGMIFGQEAFGGAGHNFFLPALVGKCFLLLSWPQPFADALKATVETFSGPGVTFGGLMLEPAAGGAGEVLPVAIIIGAILILAMKVANWRTVVAVLVPAVAVAWGLHALNVHLILTESELELLDPEKILTPLQTILSGPLLFAACFLATDFATSPETNAGKWAQGVIVGVLAVLMKSLSNYPTYTEAATFAVLMGNLFAPMIDSIVVAVRFRRAKA